MVARVLIGVVLTGVAVLAAACESPKPADPVTAAIARVPALAREVAALRGRAIGHVPAERQSRADLERFIDSELAKELPPEKNAAESRALYHLGLVETPLDLASTLRAAYVQQAAAYYDPETDRFYIVQVPDAGDATAQTLDMMNAHELVHALQDQHFDLMRYSGYGTPREDLADDVEFARSFVVEGEATLIMLAYVAKAAGQGDLLASPEGIAALRRELADLAAEPDDEQHIPRAIRAPMFESYVGGAIAVLEVYAAGGWPAVDALYREPPESTEQVLHPTSHLIAARDRPTPIALPAPPAGWTLLHETTFGELWWRVYFENWIEHEPPWLLATGWDGDRVGVWTRGDETVAVYSSIWDVRSDAASVARAFEASLDTRHVAGRVEVEDRRVRAVTGCTPAVCDEVIDLLRATR